MSPTGNNVNRKKTFVIAILGAFAIVGMTIAYLFATSERAREELIWQNRLSVVLNGRSDVIASWVTEQKKVISDLSQNQSVRLYYSNLTENLGLGDQGMQAMQEYILPLLHDRANQSGYLANDLDPDYEIKANINREKLAGLALTNIEGQILVSTPAMPTVLEAINSYLTAGASMETMMAGPYFGETGLPTVAFITPVYGLEDSTDQGALGFVVGVRILGDDFFDLLSQPGEMASSARNYLIRDKEGMIHFIQNMKPQDSGFQSALDSSVTKIIESDMDEGAGRMIEGLNHLGENVIASAVSVPETDWLLVRSISVDEALGQARSRMHNILVMSFLVIVSVGVMMALLWRHGISVRLQQALDKQKALATKHENLSTFMSVVTNSHPAEISAVDETGRYTFVNLKAAIAAESKPEDMIGKTPSAVLGKARVKADEAYCDEVLETNTDQTHIRNIGSTENPVTIKTDYVPLTVGDPKDMQEKGVLMVKEDISAIEQNRIKRELNLKSLVSTLTMIISSRDPFSATHSERVVKVASVLCSELDVDETTAATAELAGAMMNLGKILVPRELLIKPSNLTSDELSIIRSSMLKSADLIKDIEFEGPVCETLTQIQAHWDGSGQPTGLSGNDILLPARIVSVANAFVAMVSTRAHREGMDMNKAIQLLMADADKIYDRRPVVALMNYLENKNGYDEWRYFNDSSKA